MVGITRDVICLTQYVLYIFLSNKTSLIVGAKVRVLTEDYAFELPKKKMKLARGLKISKVEMLGRKICYSLNIPATFKPLGERDVTKTNQIDFC